MPAISLHIPAHLHKAVDTDSTLSNLEGGSDLTETILPCLLQTPAGFAILEIQGKINISGMASTGVTSPIGKLAFPFYDQNASTTSQSWMKTVHLYVGKHQRLTGEIKKLPKAIGVMRKQNFEVCGVETKYTREEDLEIVEIVEWKILFSNRPEPMGD